MLRQSHLELGLTPEHGPFYGTKRLHPIIVTKFSLYSMLIFLHPLGGRRAGTNLNLRDIWFLSDQRREKKK
jgi:hypothetical protein